MRDRIEHIALGTMIVASLIVAVLGLMGVLDTIPWLSGRTAAMTLLLLAVAASYLVSERLGQLNRIERLIVENTERTLSSLAGVEAKLFPTAEEAFDYMAAGIKRASHEIDHAALAPPIGRRAPFAQNWEVAIGEVLKARRVKYRYVASFSDNARQKRVRHHLKDSSVQQYYVCYYEEFDSAPPALSFILIDDREVIMHYPYEPGQAEMFLSVKHSDVVRLFAAYFRRIWASGTDIVGDADKGETGQTDVGSPPDEE